MKIHHVLQKYSGILKREELRFTGECLSSGDRETKASRNHLDEIKKGEKKSLLKSKRKGERRGKRGSNFISFLLPPQLRKGGNWDLDTSQAGGRVGTREGGQR